MAVVFMVRQGQNQEEETILREESERYHDVVQGNYTDSYHMLSYKALSSLIWGHTTLYILCYPWGNSSVRRYGKWCVRHSEYPEDILPYLLWRRGVGDRDGPGAPTPGRGPPECPRCGDDVYITACCPRMPGFPSPKNLKQSIIVRQYRQRQNTPVSESITVGYATRRKTSYVPRRLMDCAPKDVKFSKDLNALATRMNRLYCFI
ncbi:hypothetical protein GWK47_045964 [Chionoecetes opilio]|uniref:Uncharacterized protein n=1 Tax=Chionoecetes opilio TaxID=41210 RepID=A0A8J5CV04_CHIOP|nr:hypothetical protein GWK47_045964 [Chionoecetes opilio]